MAATPLQRAIENLAIGDVYVVASEARHGPGFNPKDAHALEGLKSQTMHVARRSEVLETDKTDQFLLRIVIGFGVRWVREPEDGGDLEVKALIEADYVAEYLMNERLDQEAIETFALNNASYHVWPYWREFLASQSERLRMPRLILPMKQFPNNQKQ